MAEFSIKELEILSGIKAHTIRIWEQRYALLKPSRSKTNIRFYSLQELETILNISLLNNHGFKISRINKLTQPQIQKTVDEMFAVTNPLYVLNKLFIRLFNLDMTGFENVLNKYISQEGIDATIENIIDAFLRKTELLQTHAHLKDEYRYLVKNIIRQKIITGINKLHTAYSIAKTIISFLPENHHGEIDLLYMQYLLKKQGLHTLYLGANVPVKDVVLIAHHKKTDYVYMHLDVTAHNFNAGKFLNKLSQQFSETKVVITGSALQQYCDLTPENVFIKPSAKEALQFIA